MFRIPLSYGPDGPCSNTAFPDFLISRIAKSGTSTDLTRVILSFRKRDQPIQKCLQQKGFPPKIIGTRESLISGSSPLTPLLRDDYSSTRQALSETSNNDLVGRKRHANRTLVKQPFRQQTCAQILPVMTGLTY